MNRVSTALVFLAFNTRLSSTFSSIAETSRKAAAASLSTASMMMAASILISDGYDGGNIEFVAHEEMEDKKESKVTLRIKPDPYTVLEKANHMQYFSFRSIIDTPQRVQYVIENADKASYTSAWEGTSVCTSSTINDPNSWTRIPTKYKDGRLTWSHEYTTAGTRYFAYFPPFSHSRHLELLDKCSPYAQVFSLGKTLDGREMDCVKVGTGERVCWIIHRQHPGENMAEFYAEGLLMRLLGLESGGSVDGMVSNLLRMYSFYIVPNMCPDGAVRGHLRTNAAGTNLNREWAPSVDKDGNDYDAPTLERSPEVYWVLKKMDETGVDAFLDVHGDEELPFNFLSLNEGMPNWGPRLQALTGAFLSAYCRANSDMQKKYGYEPEKASKGMKHICSNQIAFRFDCLAATLEMPFKDCMSNPDPERGWSPGRARQLGASALDALAYVYPYLRKEGEFWNELGPEDEYVRPTDKFTD